MKARLLKAQVDLPAVLPHGPLQEQQVTLDPLTENFNTTTHNFADLTRQTVAILQGPTGETAQGQGQCW